MDSSSNSIKKLYYSIGEVSKLTELKQYVLRYWETEFKQLSPSKNKAGNRTYRQKDINLILQIKNFLYNEKFTIEGARKMLSQNSNIAKEIVPLKPINKPEIDSNFLLKIQGDLKSILDELQK